MIVERGDLVQARPRNLLALFVDRHTHSRRMPERAVRATPRRAAKILGLAILIAGLLGPSPSKGVWRIANVIAFIEREEVNLLGYLAAGLVLATFCMRSMTTLRTVALVSNVAFIGYGYVANLPPVLLLHVILLPVNAYRLLQIWKFEYSKL